MLSFENRKPDYLIKCHSCGGTYRGITLTPEEMRDVREQLNRPDLPLQSVMIDETCECYVNGHTVLESPLPELKDVN